MDGSGFLRANAAFLLVSCIYIAVAWLLGFSSPRALAGDIAFATAFATMCLLVSVLVVVTRVRWRLSRDGWTTDRGSNRRAWRGVARLLRGSVLQPSRAAGFLLTMATYSVFMRHFARVKGGIGHATGFGWDPLFMELDRLLHFGWHPWQILQPLVGTPALTRLIDTAYYAWFAIVISTIAWLAWQAHSRLRTQFFLALIGTWALLGSAAAWGFASAGPIYYAQVTGDAATYGELLAYLSTVDERWGLRTFVVRDLLWAGYSGASHDMFEGIAAMPSLHVAISVLLVIAIAQVNRRIAAVYAVYAAVVLVGSVHLAWHYAIDGYASIMAVPIIWWAAGAAAALVRPDFRRSHRQTREPPAPAGQPDSDRLPAVARSNGV